MSIATTLSPAPPRPFVRLRGVIATLALAALSAVVSASASCGRATVTGPASPDSVHLALGARTLVRDIPLALTFDRVASDSRCPQDVVCVWAGDLRVQVRAESLAAAGPQPMTQLLEYSTASARVQSAFSYRLELIAERERGGGDPPPASAYWIALRVTPLPD
jgi:hypothetical protein